jgi:hypothetical protein
MITPLAFVFLLIPVLLAGLVVVAWFVLLLFNKPADAIRSVPYHEMLGLGGPDDPFTVRVVREPGQTAGTSASSSRSAIRTTGAAPRSLDALPRTTVRSDPHDFAEKPDEVLREAS